MGKMNCNPINLEVNVDVKTNISFWNAIKLRIAGFEKIQEMIENSVKKSVKKRK